MMSKITEQTAIKAGLYFEKGYNCCESVFHACIEDLEIPLDDTAKQMATAFGGGFGGSGCSCGTLSGGILVIGALKGRAMPLEASKDPAYDAGKLLAERFAEKFGKTCCRSLKKGGREVCKTYVMGVVELLGQILAK